MHTFRTLIAVAALLSLAATACTTTSERPTRGRSRSAIRVDVAADGVAELDGDRLAVEKLARRLKREGATRAVALHGADGCTRASLIHLQRQLVRLGVPNVSIVTARRALAEVEPDEAGEQPAAQAPESLVAPLPAPIGPRMHAR